jgi:hypothetical protein
MEWRQKNVRWTNLSLRFHNKPIVSFVDLFQVSDPHLLAEGRERACAVSDQPSQCVGLYSLQAYRHSAYAFVCLFSLTCHVRCTA